MENEKYHIHISSKHKLFDLKLKEVWQYRDLIWLFTKRSFTVAYKQTLLGPVWLILSPLLSSFVYTFLFGKIAGMDTDGIPQILFYLCGNAIWGHFANCFMGNAGTFTGNAGLFGKVYFPRLTTPLSVILTSCINFFIRMILAYICLIYYTWTGAVHPSFMAILVIPVVLIHLGLLGMGIGIIASSFTTKYRDLNVFIGFASSLWMYATPIVYPLSQVGDGWLKTVLIYNPVTPSIELFRLTLLGKGEILTLPLITSWIFTVVVLLIGIVIFNKIERTFMDTV